VNTGNADLAEKHSVAW